jgi:sulfate/thiosulfate transport system permease protein
MLSDEREMERLMTGHVNLAVSATPAADLRQATTEPRWLRVLISGLALLFLGIFLLIPLAAVFTEALREGIHVYLAAISSSEARSAIGLTLLTAAIAVPLNLVFGVMAAWAITRFQFPGRSLLTTLIDLPFAVSPVISGMVFVLLFGAQGLAGSWLAAHHLKIVFAVPGIVLATTFVTFPFIARELIPVMEAAGVEQELAALTLGANGWQVLFRITVPNVKWGLLYGVVTCNARAMGEFGAVSVVSGHIRGLTNTMPLYVEILYNEYDFSASFAVASLLTLLALITLIARRLLNRAGATELASARDSKLQQQEAA